MLIGRERIGQDSSFERFYRSRINEDDMLLYAHISSGY